jgi:NAD+ synthase
MPVIDTEALINNRVQAIRKFHDDAKQPRAELDLSGGVDSAVMLGLLAKALGPENVTVVHLAINSDPAALARAREAASAFKVKLIEFDGTGIFEEFIATMVRAMVKAGYSATEIANRVELDKTVLGSIRSTSRAPWGRAANRLSGGGIRHGTGNEDEDRYLRFYQKGGDGEVDTNPIAMLSKGEVFQLGIALGVPRSILLARPSPDLWGIGEQHNDETEIATQLGLHLDTRVGGADGISFYSYVDVDTGEYKNVGLIERLHRFCDTPVVSMLHSSADGSGPDVGPVDKFLFDDATPGILKGLRASNPMAFGAFKGIPENVVTTLLTNARKVEKATHHKMNPNCPMLGSRKSLIAAGILTNELPV